MKSIKNNRYFKLGLTLFFVVVASICFYYLIFFGSDFIKGINAIINILMPVVFGLVTAYLLTPVLNFIEYRILTTCFDKIKTKASDKRRSFIRLLGVLITTVLFFAVI